MGEYWGQIMSKMLITLFVGALAIFVGTCALAGTTSSKVSKILIYESGALIYVYPASGVNNPPACHGSNGNYYSFSLARTYAKEMYAGLLSAQARGATVTFYGYGDCRDQSVSETIAYVSIDN